MPRVGLVQPSRYLIIDTLDVSGDTAISGTLEVQGGSTFYSSVSINSSLTVQNGAVFSSTVQILGNLDAPNIAKATSEELHVYADGSSGSDSNDGLTVGTPKLTIPAALDLIPNLIRHNTVLHLSGTFTDPGEVEIDKVLADASYFIVDGGSDVTVVDDNSGADYTADISSTTSIGLTTAGWTVDEHFGYWVEILSGPAAGQTRAIQGNTASTITPIRDWSVDPTAGATFRIVRPATTVISSAAGNHWLRIRTLGAGTFVAQRFSIGGSKPSLTIQGASGAFSYLNHIVHYGTASQGVTASAHQGLCGISYPWFTDPTTFALLSANTASNCGVSVLNSTTVLQVYATNRVWLLGALVHTARVENCPMLQLVGYGARIRRGLVAQRSGALATTQGVALATTAGYAATTIENAAGSGLTLIDSYLKTSNPVIQNCTSHGIEMQGGMLNITGVLAGGTNTGAGLYVTEGAKVKIADGTTPTLTGTVGDISLDGLTEASTWVAIDAGVPIDASTPGNNEFVLVKEV